MTEKINAETGIFINAAACISPQSTFDNSVFLNELKAHERNKIYCVEPDYSKFLDAVAIRRMSRIVKFGTTAGLMALKESGIEKPDAISTATGYGLLEMSQRFLQDCVASGEGIVSPTTFIQSTHNTVSSNIAMIIGCNAHNNTFSQKGFSFESALYDACLLMMEGAENILVGAYEEVGEFNYASMVQAGELKTEPCNNLKTYDYSNNGNILGEGAAFFVLSKAAAQNTYGKLKGVHTFYRPKSEADCVNELNVFLKNCAIVAHEIDVVIIGISGNKAKDDWLQSVTEKCFHSATLCRFKHLCGEYMTASAFAFWLAARIMKTQSIPETLLLKNTSRKPSKILLYNAYNHYHSAIMFENG